MDGLTTENATLHRRGACKRNISVQHVMNDVVGGISLSNGEIVRIILHTSRAIDDNTTVLHFIIVIIMKFIILSVYI